MSSPSQISPVAVLAALADVTPEKLSTARARALAIFDVVGERQRLAWDANGAAVEVLSREAGEYCVTVDGVQRDKGTLDDTFATVQGLVTELAGARFKPTTSARPYEQWGNWADMQGGYLMFYPMHTDGGWDKDYGRVEYACQHIVERVNADFGTKFTMDDFEEGCECE